MMSVSLYNCGHCKLPQLVGQRCHCRTPEDEAFDELAQRQGSWGGGFQAKRAAAADKQEPAQKPIAYVTGTYSGRFVVAPLNPAMVLPVGMAFYTTPPQRPWVGLTPEDILGLFDEHNLYGSKLVEFARAVETKLKDKNNGL